MLQNLNLIAYAIVFLGSAWLVLSKRVPTHSGSALLLFALSFSAIGRMARVDHTDDADLFALSCAAAFCWAFYRVEITKTWGRSGTIGW